MYWQTRPNTSDSRDVAHVHFLTCPSFYQECREDGTVGEALLVRCGTIEAGFAYDLPTRTLTVHILQAKEVPSKDRGGAANTQVSTQVRHRLRGGSTPTAKIVVDS